jgi:hypothetical protein
MKEVRLTLDFACSHCQLPVSVTVQCSGRLNGVDVSRLVACVSIPCPDCQGISQLYFDPTGTVHGVEPYHATRAALEPSLN